MFNPKEELTNPKKLKKLIKDSDFYNDGDEYALSEYMTISYKENLEDLSLIVKMYGTAYFLERISKLAQKMSVEDIINMRFHEVFHKLQNLY